MLSNTAVKTTPYKPDNVPRLEKPLIRLPPPLLRSRPPVRFSPRLSRRRSLSPTA